MSQRKRVKVKASIERLFSEPFVPQWVDAKERQAQYELDHLVTRGVDMQWKKAAEESRQRIADRFPSKMNLKRFDGTERE